MMGWGGYGYGMGFLGGLFMLVFWGLIVIGLVFAICRVWNLGAGGTRTGAHETSLEILKRRYAQGEISKAEYDRMKHDLT